MEKDAYKVAKTIVWFGVGRLICSLLCYAFLPIQLNLHGNEFLLSGVRFILQLAAPLWLMGELKAKNARSLPIFVNYWIIEFIICFLAFSALIGYPLTNLAFSRIAHYSVLSVEAVIFGFLWIFAILFLYFLIVYYYVLTLEKLEIENYKMMMAKVGQK